MAVGSKSQPTNARLLWVQLASLLKLDTIHCWVVSLHQTQLCCDLASRQEVWVMGPHEVHMIIHNHFPTDAIWLCVVKTLLSQSYVSAVICIYILYIYIILYYVISCTCVYIYIYIYCGCVWNGVFHQFMTMLVGNWVLIHCSLNFMTHPHNSIPLHYIPNRQPLFWIQDIATRTSMMTGSQTLAFAIFHVKVLATLRPVRSCDAPATSNILFILWKLYMNATSSRFIEPNAMVSTYDPSKNQLQALDPTAVEDWWWAELIYGIWATYSQVQAQNDEVCLQREGTPAFYLLCFSSERQENQLNRRVTYDMRSVLILLALCIRMREPPKYPKFQTKTERSHSKCSEWTNTQYISILCCFFMLILCIRLTWSTRELGPCFFTKPGSSQFSPGHHAGFSVRSPHAGAKHQWSCLCWSHQTHENHAAGGESQGWWKPPKGGLLCAWKWGIPATSTIPPTCG